MEGPKEIPRALAAVTVLSSPWKGVQRGPELGDARGRESRRGLRILPSVQAWDPEVPVSEQQGQDRHNIQLASAATRRLARTGQGEEKGKKAG